VGTATDKVIDQIIENRTKFKAFCESLTDEQLDRPVPQSTWIVRDFAAHLDTLDPAMQRLFEATARNEKLTAPDGGEFDVDAFNEPLVTARRDWPLSRVFEEAAENRVQLVQALRQITDEQTRHMMWFGGDAKRKAGNIPFGLFLAGWAWHDPIHLADMLRALPERAADPDVVAWLDNGFVKGYQAAMNR